MNVDFVNNIFLVHWGQRKNYADQWSANHCGF